MEREMESLLKLKTFELVHKPADKPVIGCRWVYKVKRDKSGHIDKLKARLVAQGFAQQHGVNYFETYSPVVKCSTIRLLMAIAVKCDFKIEQIDIRNAYVNSDLGEEIYMRQPKGFESSDKSKVLKLYKSLYGLKQSGHKWNACLNNTLVNELKFERLKSDTCVYKKGQQYNMIIIAVYVDDMIIMAKNESDICNIKGQISAKFDIDNIGELKRIIGINVKCADNSIVLDQKHQIDELIKSSGLTESYCVRTPIDPSVKLLRCEDEGRTSQCGEVDNTSYRSLIGQMNYIASMTRPDLTHCVSYLSQFNSCPHKEHMEAAKRAVRYLKGTSDRVIRYNKVDDELLAYVDADWGACPNTRKSYSGVIVKLSGGPISWESHKQSTVALSSVEAEYMAVTQASKEILFISSIVRELGMRALYGENGFQLMCDNQGAMSLARNNGYSPRSKHIDIRYHFIRNLVQDKLIKLEYIKSEFNEADILTKGLGNIKHEFFLNKLLV